MMHPKKIGVFVVAGIICIIQALPGPCSRSAPGKVMPIQLKGLKSVLFGAYVDNCIPRYNDLEAQIRGLSGKVLTDSDLSLDGKQGAVLFIDVTLYPIQSESSYDGSIVQVRTSLTENVSLCRDPALQLPDGAVTWEQTWVELKLRRDLEDFIEKVALDQVESFCDEWSLVKRLENEKM